LKKKHVLQLPTLAIRTRDTSTGGTKYGANVDETNVPAEFPSELVELEVETPAE
jgi:hypothetical protein